MNAFRRLAVIFALAFVTFGGTLQRSATAQGASKTASAKPSAAAQGGLLDINTATDDQLKGLPGIGDAYSKRIIAGRPYRAKNQLVSKGVLPQATYDKISSMIIAKQAK